MGASQAAIGSDDGLPGKAQSYPDDAARTRQAFPGITLAQMWREGLHQKAHGESACAGREDQPGQKYHQRRQMVDRPRRFPGPGGVPGSTNPVTGGTASS